jgi:group I intron endonuclease
MYGYIYLTTNLINNKKYIGQHKGDYDRKYLGTGIAIINAIKKYGKENFTCEVLEYCESKEKLDEKEIEYIKRFNAVEDQNFYNQVEGGRGGILYERRDGEHNPFHGKTQTDYQKERVSEALKGRKRPPEVIAKLPQNQKGYKLSEEQKKKLGKTQVILDKETNKTFEFNSIGELVIELKISKYDYYKAKSKNQLIVGRYQIIREEEKYGNRKH